MYGMPTSIEVNMAEMYRSLFYDFKEFDSYDDMEVSYKDCAGCDLCERPPSTHPILSRIGGLDTPSSILESNQAPVLVIGESPSIQDLKNGIPMSDNDGLMLRMRLQHNSKGERVGINSDHTMFTYLIGCPIQLEYNYKRIITDDQFNNCRSRIETIISICNPTIVILVGVQVMVRLLGSRKPEAMAHPLQYLGEQLYRGITTYTMPRIDYLYRMDQASYPKGEIGKQRDIIDINFDKLVLPAYKYRVCKERGGKRQTYWGTR